MKPGYIDNGSVQRHRVFFQARVCHGCNKEGEISDGVIEEDHCDHFQELSISRADLESTGRFLDTTGCLPERCEVDNENRSVAVESYCCHDGNESDSTSG